jgi:hypothetical protein
VLMLKVRVNQTVGRIEHRLRIAARDDKHTIAVNCHVTPYLDTLSASISLYTDPNNDVLGTPKWRTRKMDKAVRGPAVEVIQIGKPGVHVSPEPKRAGDTVIMEIVEDQNPHSLLELATRANLPVQVVRAFVHFLAKYALVTYDGQKQIVVISPEFAMLD